MYSLVENDENARHVVTSDSLGSVWGKTLVKKLLGDGTELDVAVSLESVSGDLAELLSGEDLPNSVTSHKDELVFWLELSLDDVWLGRDELLGWLEPGVLLVLEVTNSSGKIKVSVNSSFDDETTGLGDSVLLDGVLWLVVLG